MDQFDQLLTCCVCLDRYRTPKMLPCQHNYCQEPCMEVSHYWSLVGVT